MSDDINEIPTLEEIRRTSEDARRKAHKPSMRKFARQTVDDMVEGHTEDIMVAPMFECAHGIPVTREEFDSFYAVTQSLPITGKETVRHFVKMAALPDGPQIHAIQIAINAKYIEPSVIEELKKRHIDTSAYEHNLIREAIGPSDLDLGRLDPRLTPLEKAYVTFMVEASRIAVKDLVSTAEDAPPTSRWANRIKLQQGFADQNKPQRLN